METFEALKRFRKEQAVSQRQLAKRIGVPYQSYQTYESGSSVPSSKVIKKIAVAFDVSADYLLGLTDEPRPKPQEVRDKEFFERVEAGVAELQKALRKASADRVNYAEHEPNEETIKAIEDVERGTGLSQRFSSVDEMLEDLVKNA